MKEILLLTICVQVGTILWMIQKKRLVSITQLGKALENSLLILITLVINDAATGAKEKALLSMEISLGELKKLDTEKYLEFKRAYDLHTKKGAGDITNFALQNDVNTEALFEMDIVKVNPQYDMSDVVTAQTTKGTDYYKTMVQKYSNLYDEDFKAAISRMKQELGVPSDMYLDKTWLNSQEANVLSAAISAMNKARRKMLLVNLMPTNGLLTIYQL